MIKQDDDGLLELSDVLARLGKEFQKASVVEDPTIEWHNAEVEITSTVTRGADGGIRFWVVSAGGKVADENTIKVTVHLNPFGGEPMAGGM